MDCQDQEFPQEINRSVVGGTQAVARAASLLREIAANGATPASLADLASRLGLERPTAYRILQRLVVEGLAEQDPLTKGYGLGPLLYELGLAANPPLRLHSMASEALHLLAQESADTVYAIVRSGLDSLCLDRQEGGYPVKALMMNTGRRRPMGIGAGSLSLLAAMPAPEADRILEVNTARIRAAGEESINELRQEIENCRSRGFSLRGPTEAPEILSLAIAVCNSYGTPVLALSISALAFRIEQRRDQLLTMLRGAGRTLEKRLSAQSYR